MFLLRRCTNRIIRLFTCVIVGMFVMLGGTTAANAACGADQIDVAGNGTNCQTTKFSVGTSSIDVNGTIVFSMSARGTFYVDCGDGGSLSGTGASGKTITRYNTTSAEYTCTYSSSGTKTIRFAGTATVYNTSSTAAISFYKSSGGTQDKITSISGNLSSMFPKLNTSATGAQPRFSYAFSGTQITSIPATLFSGYTTGAQYMFDNTFSGCKSLIAIQAGLFSSIITGTGATCMFRSTFSGCTSLTTIPAGLFSSITTGAGSMFYYTFNDCKSLNAVPENLFAGITTSVNYMFQQTFNGCTNLSGYIPPSAFAGLVANGSPTVSSMWYNTFAGTALRTSCPSGTKQYITGYEGKEAYATWSGKVSCISNTLMTITLDTTGATTGATPSTVYLSYNTAWSSDSAGNNVITGLTTLPTKTGKVFGGFYTGQNGTGIQVIDENGNFISKRVFYDTTTLYAYFGDASYTVTYSCGDGTGTPPANTTAVSGGQFIPADGHVCSKEGYAFAGWAVSGTSDNVVAPFTWNYTANKTLTAQWFESKISIGTSNIPVDGEFQFVIVAKGTFYVDCGNGGTLSKTKFSRNTTGEGVISGTTVTNTDAGRAYLSCTYSTAGEKTIHLGGLATGYSASSTAGGTNAVLQFCHDSDGQPAFPGTPQLVKSFNGVLSEIFPVLGTTDDKIPCFANLLRNTKITSVPANLFSGINKSRTFYMFYKTFAGCTSLTSIPAGLFSDITTGASSMFSKTFQGCTNLGGYIPPTTFAGLIAHGAPTASSMWSDTFTNTALRTSCPSDTAQYITGYESEWNGKVSCVSTTPMAITLDTTGATTGATPSTVYLSYKTAWSSDSAGNNVITGLTTLPTKTGKVFGGFYTGQNGTGIKVIDENGNFIDNSFTTEPITVYAYFGNSSHTVTYSCGNGSGTPPVNATAVSGGQFIPAANSCTKTGYTFTGWSVSGTDDLVGSAPFTWNYNGDKTLTAQWVENAFRLTTTSLSSGDTFKFTMSATGTFTVDCGIDGTLSSTANDVSGNTITRSDTSSATYTCTYSSDGAKTISFAGPATGYSTSDTTAAISFYGGTPAKVASISGSLGAVFPTLGQSNGQQPRFYKTFEKCTNLTSIPADLFAGITGNATGMFRETFDESGVTSVPSGLFRYVSGGADNMFRSTFYGCTSLTSVPSGLFNTITSAASYLFKSLFYGCTNLTSIPAGLFSNITSSATYMFHYTFYNCSNLSNYIPATTFAGLVANNHPYADNMMTDIFYGTSKLATSCPTGTEQYTTGYESYWNNRVSCVEPVPEPITLDASNGDTDATPSTVYLKYNTGWYSDSGGNTSISALTTIPTKANNVFTGFYTEQNGAGTKIIDESGNILSGKLTFTITATTLYAHFVPSYTVTYACGTGTTGTPPAAGTVTSGLTFTPAGSGDCAKEGYIFAGWGVSDTNDVVNAPFTWNYDEDKTLTAQWVESKFSVTTTNLGAGDEFRFGMSASGVFYVNWGDGYTEIIDRTNDTEYATYFHEYDESGTYTITFGGRATGYDNGQPGDDMYNSTIMFGNDGDCFMGCNLTPEYVASVSGSLGALFPTLGNNDNQNPNFYGTFSNCENLTSISADLFSGIITGAEYMFSNTFNGCTSLTSIPAGLFAGITTGAVSMFISTFQNCTSLTTIPSGLFAGITTGADSMFYSTFQNCTSLTSIPSGLFASNITNTSNASYMFYGTFYNCTSLTTIPSGLFAGITTGADSMFYQTFDNCTSLTTIPSGLFSGITTGAQYMFADTFDNCTSLTTIPSGLFSGITTGADGMFVGTFFGCTSLTTIPSDLFSGITTVGQYMFYRTFRDCTSLTSIPAGLFSGITTGAQYMFRGTFHGCTSLTTIPAGLFSGITTAASYMFYGTFQGCTSLTSIPAGLFSGITTGADSMFGYTFYDCTNLTGYIPPSTFAGLIANNHPTASAMWTDAFTNTALATSCPSGTAQYITGYEGSTNGTTWNGKVSCGYAVEYSCGDGTGTPPASAVAENAWNFTTASDSACSKSGQNFLGWTVSGTNDLLPAETTSVWDYNTAKTLTATWSETSIRCSAGQYLRGSDSTCQSCPGDSYCSSTSVVYEYNANDQGKTPCPEGFNYNTQLGKTSVNQCQIHCDAGTYLASFYPGYTLLEYVENTGSSYIDTGVSHLSTNIHGEFHVGTTNAITANSNIMGTQSSSSSIKGYSVGWDKGFKIWIQNGGKKITGPAHALGANTEHHVEFDFTATTDSITYDGTTTPGTHSGLGDQNTFHLFEGGNHQSDRYFKGRIYDVKIYEDNVLVHHFVPVRRDSDNALGVYDIVNNGGFKVSTGALTAGNVVSDLVADVCVNVGTGHYATASVVNYGDNGTRNACPIGTYSDVDNGTSVSACKSCPGATYNDTTGAAACLACPTGYDYNTTSGKTSVNQCQIHCDAGTYLAPEYTQLEYIETTGASQFINTNINLSSTVNPIMSVTVQHTEIINDRAIAGIKDNFTIGTDANGNFAIQTGSNETPTVFGAADTNKHTFVLDTEHGTASIDGNSSALTVGTLSSSYSIFVGRRNNDSYSPKAKLYNFNLISNGVQVLNLVPARRNSDAEVGMLDTLTNTFYAPGSQNGFLAGPTTEHDTVLSGACVAVGTGYYAGASTTNYGAAGTRTACPIGTYSDVTNGTSASACKSCSGATYNALTGAAACMACPAGYDDNTTSGKTSINQCQQNCDAGTYMAEMLPAEYTQLEYIESTGTQFVNSGVVYRDLVNPVMSLTVQYTSPQVTKLNGVLFSNLFAVGIGYHGQFVCATGSASRVSDHTSMGVADTNKHTFVLDIPNATCSLDGTTKTLNSTAFYYKDTRTINIGRLNPYDEHRANAKYYHFSLVNDGVKIRDMYPARRNSDNVLGMYDIVNDVFYPGQGTFVAGPNIVVGSCANVGTGYYAAAATVNYGDADDRTACPVGTYSDVDNGTSLSVCQSCSGATYNDTPGAASCMACPVGYDYNTTSGKTSVNQCQIHCDGGTYVRRRLPAGYTPLEYIQANGSQRLAMGVGSIANLVNPILTTTIQYTTVENDRWNGYRNLSTTDTFGVGIDSNGKFAILAGIDGTGTLFGDADTEKHTFVLDTLNSTASMDGTTLALSVDTLSSNPLYAIGVRDNSAGRPRAKYYHLSLISDGETIRDMYPARRDSDNVLGMYDVVNDVFYTDSISTAGPVLSTGEASCTNVGIGYYAAASTVNYDDFGTRTMCPTGTYSGIDNASACQQCTGATYSDTAGAAACSLCPFGYDYDTSSGKISANQCQSHCAAGTVPNFLDTVTYQELEYIESTGAQYIDAGIDTANLNTPIISLTVQHTAASSSQQSGRSYSFSGQVATGHLKLGISINGQFFCQAGPADSETTMGAPDTNKHTFVLDTQNATCSLDDTVAALSVANDWKQTDATGAFLIGAVKERYNAAGDERVKHYSKAKYYRFTLVDNGVTIRDLIPVKRRSDNAVGMYDTTRAEFYPSATETAFIAGPAKGDANSDAKCIPVGLGYYAPENSIYFGGASPAVACPIGTYSDVDNGTSASACKSCAGATYNDTPAAAACTACPGGWNYNTTSGKTSVNQCQAYCAAGTYASAVIPAPYTQLEYIESTGTQYIRGDIRSNTWVDPIISLTTQFTSVMTDTLNGGSYPALGVAFYMGIGNTGQFYITGDRRNDRVIAEFGPADTNKHTFILNAQNATATLDNTILPITIGPMSWSAADTNGAGVFFDIGGGYARSTAETDHYTEAKYYHFSFINNGVLVRDMWPVLRNVDNVAGMYDVVNGVFYPGSGADAFVAGPVAACATTDLGYYAAANTVNYGSLGTQNACPVGYPMSTFGATAQTECFTNCTVAQVAHSTAVSGSAFYGGTNTCVPADANSCDEWYHYVATNGNVLAYCAPDWCEPGKYLPDNANECAACPLNHYCTGGSGENFGSATQCPNNLYSPVGMWESAQCGRILHIGDNVIYLRSTKQTTPSLNIDIDNDGTPDYFGNMTTADVVMNSGTERKLKISFGGQTYSVYDDTVTSPEEPEEPEEPEQSEQQSEPEQSEQQEEPEQQPGGEEP